MASVNQIRLGGTTYDLGSIKNRIFYGECHSVFDDGAYGDGIGDVTCPEITHELITHMWDDGDSGMAIFVYFGSNIDPADVNMLCLTYEGGEQVVLDIGNTSVLHSTVSSGQTVLFTCDTSNYEFFFVPMTDSNDDYKVQQNYISTGTGKLLIKGNNNNSTLTDSVRFSSNIEATRDSLTIINDTYGSTELLGYRASIAGTGSQPPAYLVTDNNGYFGTNSSEGITTSFGVNSGDSGEIVITGLETTSDGYARLKVNGNAKFWAAGGGVAIADSWWWTNGVRTTISATEPSSPHNNDIWFDLSSAYGQGQYMIAHNNSTSSVTVSADDSGNMIQVTCDTVMSSYGDIMELSGGGIKVKQAGKYRVWASLYNRGASFGRNNTASITWANVYDCTKGLYVWAGQGSYATVIATSSNEKTNTLAFLPQYSTINVAPILMDLSANDVVYLAHRSFQGGGVYYPGNKATYLAVEKMPE